MEKIVQNNLYGILWIVANSLNMAVQTATLKHLSLNLPISQVVFLYKLTVFVCVFLWAALRGFKKMKTQKAHLLFLRAILNVSAALIFVGALKHIQLDDAMAIGYTEALLSSLFAIIILKESFNIHIVIAAIIGFVGVVVVLRPGTSTFNSYALWVLVAAFMWACENIVIKFLGKTENPLQYLFYISFFTTLLALIYPIFFATAPNDIHSWVPIHLWQLPGICALAVFYLLHLLLVFKGYQFADLSVVAPFDFSRVIFGAIISITFFAGHFDKWVIIGGMIIFSSSAYIVWKRENPTTKAKKALVASGE